MARPSELLLSLLSGSRLFSAARGTIGRRGRFVLVFHGVCHHRRSEVPRSIEPSLSADELEAVLGWLERRFEFLHAEQFLYSDRPGVLLTFDDGFANNVTNALPLLERFAAPAVFFVASQHVIDPRNWLPFVRAQVEPHWRTPDLVPRDVAADLFDGMSVEQLRHAARHPLITIAAHTVHHPFLTRIGPEEARLELMASREQLEQISDQPVTLFAYPYGDYDLEVAQLTRRAGYQAAFVENSRACGMPAAEVPRIGIYAAKPAYLDAKLSGLFRSPLRGSVLGTTNRPQSWA